MNLQIEVSSIFEFCVYTCIHLFPCFAFLFLVFAFSFPVLRFHFLRCVFISCFAFLFLVFAFSFLVLRFHLVITQSALFGGLAISDTKENDFFFRKLPSCFNTRVGRKFGFRSF